MNTVAEKARRWLEDENGFDDPTAVSKLVQEMIDEIERLEEEGVYHFRFEDLPDDEGG